MKIINFGSINIDYVYRVNHIVQAGETIDSKHFARFAGGKGLNQSVAVSRAGSPIFHVGMIGEDGIFLKQFLEEQGVNTEFVQIANNQPTGHAIIQVDDNGQNSIVLFSGANYQFTESFIDDVLNHFDKDDFVILQNEINATPYILKKAREKKMRVFFNPAPMNAEVLEYPLNCVDCFIVNEIEGAALTSETDPDNIVSAILKQYPESSVILTLGERGSIYAAGQMQLKMEAEKVDAIDTTAAGDTFIGYFVSEMAKQNDIETCLKTATKAASLCVTQIGAADSIPKKDVVI